MKKIEARDIVQAFLNSFHSKMAVWGIIFIDRKKDEEAMMALGITPSQREDIIRRIESEDYIETTVDELTSGDMWVFGKTLSEEELYIKVSIGRPNSNTICISFHKSEYPNKYAFKRVSK